MYPRGEQSQSKARAKRGLCIGCVSEQEHSKRKGNARLFASVDSLASEIKGNVLVTDHVSVLCTQSEVKRGDECKGVSVCK